MSDVSVVKKNRRKRKILIPFVVPMKRRFAYRLRRSHVLKQALNSSLSSTSGIQPALVEQARVKQVSSFFLFTFFFSRKKRSKKARCCWSQNETTIDSFAKMTKQSL